LSNGQAATATVGTGKPSSGRTTLPTAKVYRYAERVIRAYDSNGDGQLDTTEWGQLRGDPARIDANRDELLGVQEFANYVTRYAARRRIRLLTPELAESEEEPPLLQPISARAASDDVTASPSAGEESGDELRSSSSSADIGAADIGPEKTSGADRKATQRRRDQKYYTPASRFPAGLPSWFHSRDLDGDGQISLAEYSPTMTRSALAEFNRYDRNRDGLITSRELAAGTKSGKSAKGRNSSSGSKSRS
jgi:hypothetical protein